MTEFLLNEIGQPAEVTCATKWTFKRVGIIMMGTDSVLSCPEINFISFPNIFFKLNLSIGGKKKTLQIPNPVFTSMTS